MARGTNVGLAIEGDPDHGPLDKPPVDSTFEVARQYDGVCRCRYCRALVWSNPESREAHLNRTGCHVLHARRGEA